jgi:hypothetical protein
MKAATFRDSLYSDNNGLVLVVCTQVSGIIDWGKAAYWKTGKFSCFSE